MPTLKNCGSLSSNHLIGSPPENHQSIVISTMQLGAVSVSRFLAQLGQGDLTAMEGGEGGRGGGEGEGKGEGERERERERENHHES